MLYIKYPNKLVGGVIYLDEYNAIINTISNLDGEVTVTEDMIILPHELLHFVHMPYLSFKDEISLASFNSYTLELAMNKLVYPLTNYIVNDSEPIYVSELFR
jgi:hypothetical protein